MKIDTSNYKLLLDAKAVELTDSLRKRGRITVETSAEETEQMLLKDERDFALLAIDRDVQTLREVRSAMARLEGECFGLCEECEQEISARRLMAVPWARRCVGCQEETDRAAAASTFRPLQLAA